MQKTESKKADKSISRKVPENKYNISRCLEKTCILVSEIIKENENFQTIIPFLSFIRSTKKTLPKQGILKPSFCIIIQGSKKIQIGKDIIPYGAGEYLISTIDIPTSGQIFEASDEAPYLAIRIELDIKEIADIIIDAKIDLGSNKKVVAGAFIKESNIELIEAIHKLVRIIDSPADVAFLAPSIKREIIYRLLTTSDGHLLQQIALLDTQDLGIGKAINLIKQNFAHAIKIEQLAKEVNMSVSSLHHKFKTVTTMGPLQYQKQLRLQEARKVLLTGLTDASTAAYQVGYESLSQFNREYKRLFGDPPMRDIKNLRDKSII